MVIDMDSTTDNIFSFRPTCLTLRDRKLDYVEPRPYSARLTKNPFSLESIDILIPNQPPTKDPSPSPSCMTPSKHPRHSPLKTPTKVDSVSPYYIAKMHLHNIPYICNTAYPSDTRQYFDPLKLHQIFVYRQFCNPKHSTFPADDTKQKYL